MIFWTLIFFAIAAQGFYLATLLILRREKDSQKDLIMGLFTFFVSLLLLFWVGFWNELEQHYAHFNLLYNPIPFLISPLLYLYLLSFERRLVMKDSLHFMPFLMAVGYFLPFYVLDENTKIHLLQNHALSDVLWGFGELQGVYGYLQWISLILYGAICLGYSNRSPFLRGNLALKKWVLKLVSIFFLFALISILSDIIVFSYKVSINTYVLSAALLGICIYLIGYRAFNPIKPAEPIEEVSNTRKYSRSSLRDQEVPAMVSSIISYLEDQKPYLKEGYKLNELSKDIGIPAHHISQLLNTYHDTSYSALINSYRVEEAKRLLLADEYSNIKISSIGYDVGFNSRTSFYQWFKKLTGLTPTAYQRRHKTRQYNS